MIPDIITLVREDPRAHGVREKPDLIKRQVRCFVRSVGMQESYQAMANGLNPSIVLELRTAADYSGEKIAIYKDKMLSVVRTYQTGRGIELTCEEITADAAIMTDESIAEDENAEKTG